ncbi:hypothetical protein TYRP_012865 [Tyrophagus putrescentiae]|nr:hypothetical protein TYRP_012865 [Tyrophagus putrescentiae]
MAMPHTATGVSHFTRREVRANLSSTAFCFRLMARIVSRVFWRFASRCAFRSSALSKALLESTRTKVPERPMPALQWITVGPCSALFRQPDARTA